MNKHTRLPWETEGNPSDDPDPRWQIVSMTTETILAVTCGGNDQANAEFIVLACNGYKGLQTLLEDALDWIEGVVEIYPEAFSTEIVDELKAAIAKPEQESTL